ncbi:MAG TPA: hypothetical protein VHV77_07565, partial [Pirellulales bacterium]|nr:hypothetical protein [Pirellulales bacterium]
RHGLPLVSTRTLDELPEPLRTKMEQAYLDACREVGSLLLDRGKVRDAWVYLRPVGDKDAVRVALEKLPSDENFESMIELAIYEGIAPKLGFELVLQHYGLCNAISVFEGEMGNRTRAEKQEIAPLLVRYIHDELMASLKADIKRQQGAEPTESTIAEMVRDRDWLFTSDNYHVDTTHLNAIVRFALLVDDPETLRLALDLSEYGRRLSEQFQFHGDEPFVDMYRTSAMFFKAILGEEVDEALQWFAAKAEEKPLEEVGSGPAEVYVGLLARLGRYEDAMRAAARLLPSTARGGHFAPSLLELAQLAGRYDALSDICRERGDLLGFAVALLGQSAPAV